MVVDQLKKRANASMKDHFLDNWANLKSATQIAELFDNYDDVRKPRISLFTFGNKLVVEISGNFGTVQTKAAVCGNHLNQHGRYLLGNKTAELIKGNLGYNFLPVEILNAVQTRSQVKAAREERGTDGGEAKKGEEMRPYLFLRMQRTRNFNNCTPGICSGISAAKGYARKFNQC
ncbi:hypothetical protein TNCV_1276751 [Trichonephila clavipes]|nr:hypothetical protein TNCV_1276751 [Trichonephila clavipes]